MLSHECQVAPSAAVTAGGVPVRREEGEGLELPGGCESGDLRQG